VFPTLNRFPVAVIVPPRKTGRVGFDQLFL
jgi:hypothetical protein